MRLVEAFISIDIPFLSARHIRRALVRCCLCRLLADILAIILVIELDSHNRIPKILKEIIRVREREPPDQSDSSEEKGD